MRWKEAASIVAFTIIVVVSKSTFVNTIKAKRKGAGRDEEEATFGQKKM